MPVIDVDGARITYAQEGRGAPVIALHSSACSGAQWRSLQARLAGAYRVIAPDLIGYGGSDLWPVSSAPTLAEEARRVSALIDQAGGPVHLVGHSYGGAVALRVALERPDRLTSLTLIEPVAFQLLRVSAPAEAVLFEEIGAIDHAVRMAARRGDPELGMARFVDYWNGVGAWSGLPSTKRQVLAAMIATIVANFQATMGEPTPLQAYAKLDVPTLLLEGVRSPATTRRIVELLAATLPTVDRLAVDGGHMLPLSHQDQVNGAINDHLTRHGHSVWRLAA